MKKDLPRQPIEFSEERPRTPQGYDTPKGVTQDWKEKLYRTATTREFLIGANFGLFVGIIIGTILVYTLVAAISDLSLGLATCVLIALILGNCYCFYRWMRTFRQR